MGTYLPGTETLGWVVWSGTGIPRSWGTPDDFYQPHVDVGLPVPDFTPFCATPPPLPLHGSVHLPLLPIWMNVASLNPWLLYQAQFSDNSGWYLFCSLVVFLTIVVRGGKACLPTLPSWPVVTFSHILWDVFVSQSFCCLCGQFPQYFHL